MKLQGTMTINAQGHLCIGGCVTAELVKKYGTPLYVIDEEHLRQICREYYQAFMSKYPDNLVLYASKAFMTKAMVKIIKQENLGLDVVSGGELYTAIQAGFPPEYLYFHGNNKSREELEYALECKIGRIVVDNFYELELLNGLCQERGIKAKILLRITPGIEAHTHEYVQTGQIDSKFGNPIVTGQALEIVNKALSYGNIDLKGIHCHIGSQIFEVDSFRHSTEVMMGFLKRIKADNGQELEELNLGGGFGIYYYNGDTPAPISEFAEVIMNTIKQKATEYRLKVPRIQIEPGRAIIGTAGTTLYTVGSIKEIPGIRTYVAVDGGMGDNPRPALYHARYEAAVANKMKEEATELVSITGKCCETGDMLIWDIKLPPMVSSDILAISCTGAYNYSMSSNYNRLPRPAVVLVNQGQADLIVARETYADLVRNDLIPERLEE